MNTHTLRAHYRRHRHAIAARLAEFKALAPEQHFHEFLFCTLTPQSEARRCWSAVEEILKLPVLSKPALVRILKTKTRFHNNKAAYILHNQKHWPTIQEQLNTPDRAALRNWLADNVRGYGLKEASHFLRNIGCSENKVAILDRHILRNLHKLRVISAKDTRIRNKAHYLALEQKFLAFSQKTRIPIDHLDLLFWSKETGEIFK